MQFHNKIKLLVMVTIVVTASTVYALTFDPGAYPNIYRSAASAGATPAVGADVIKASGTSMSVACEWYNTSAGTNYYTIYASGTVAGQSPSNILCAVNCAATSFCSCAGPEPSGPAVNGGLISGNGLSWGSAPYFPGPTASPNPVSWAECTFK